MVREADAIRRLHALSSWLAPAHVDSSSPPELSNPELVPFGFDTILTNSPWAENHLHWLQQKDSLGQDIYLLGGHSPLKRWLALMFCARLGREMEYVALTADTSESDLKQRREILPEGSVDFVDQAPVQAAIHGRVLVIEGLEKVERNVMPVLNNLLENREMVC
jgi:midasin (ATPase involved in ribosome maturation)